VLRSPVGNRWKPAKSVLLFALLVLFAVGFIRTLVHGLSDAEPLPEHLQQPQPKDFVR
jgi:hypothetical protein